jgi:LAO/AO transport system kinase
MDTRDQLMEGGAEFAAEEKGREGSALAIMPGVTVPAAPSGGNRARRPRSRDLSVDEHVAGILAGDRVVLGRTITLVESMRAEHNDKALAVLHELLPHTGRSIRIGITGVPGVGKSTFIEALGTWLTAQGRRLAVLAIDPSSTISGGSIMGDKTRMEKLSADDRAFIRPSPSAGSLGGVARKTREAMLICEAAGFDVILIETVGVGQSETLVHSMVDFFLLLMLAGAGDQLQGIKRGIMELADALAITKADGDNLHAADHARGEYRSALHYMTPTVPDWHPPVHVCSALTGGGIAELWETIERHRTVTTANGYRERNRREQALAWMNETIDQALHHRFRTHASVAAMLPALEAAVADGTLPPLAAAQQLLEAFFGERVVES